jgi:hypothetical protein
MSAPGCLAVHDRSLLLPHNPVLAAYQGRHQRLPDVLCRQAAAFQPQALGPVASTAGDAARWAAAAAERQRPLDHPSHLLQI